MISHWATDTARYSAMRRLAAGIMHKVRLSGLHLQEEQAALVGCRLRRLQAPPPGTDGAKLGSRDGLPVQQTRAISARLDGLLRHLRVIPTDSRIGRMATPMCTPVLLETVAPDPHEDQPLFGTGRRQVVGDCYGSQR